MASSENTCDGTQLALPRQNHSASSHASKSMGVTYYGWRHASKDFMSWAHKLSKTHQHTWRKAGIFEAIMASTKKIHKDPSLILAVADKWCSQTNSFVFPWGEATITLEDVMVLLGFSVLGLPHFASLGSAEDKRTKKKLEKVCLQIKKEKTFNANQVTWVSRFMDSGDELEHVAFLALWLCYFVFPTRYYFIDEAVLPIAVHLSNGRRIALAPAVLSHLYAELSLLRNHIGAVRESTIPLKIDLCALFKIVQVWTWERFRELQPPNPMLKGDQRLALWHDLERKKRKTKKAMKAARNATQVLENSTLDSFEWRPYTTPVENWMFPQIDDELLSYARCIRVSELVGIDCVEHYFPNRVASQFGMVQEITCPVNKKHLSQDEAWRNYDKPINDLMLYIPSRSITTQAAPRINQFLQLQWSSMENPVVEPDETLTPGGVSTSFVHPGAEMGGTSKDGMNISEESMNKKLAREEDGRSMVCVRTQVPADNDDDDEEADRLTIGQWLKRRSNNKYGDADRSGGDDSESVGKRSRLEADYNNESSPCHNLASIRDELEVPGNNADHENTMIDDGSKASNCHEDAGDETEQRNEETNENGSQADENILIPSDENDFSSLSPQESMQTCDDELDVHGSNADENTITNDVSKEPGLLHEDGVIAGDDGMNIAEEEVYKKRDREDGESSMVCFQTQVPSDHDDTEEADRLTNAQRLKRRFSEKYIYVRRSRGDASKRSGLEADVYNDSGSCHDLASKSNETKPLPEIEQRNEDGDETGSNTGKTLVLSLSDGNNVSSPPLAIVASPPESMQNCDDELNVHGSNADGNLMTDDGSKAPVCLLNEDGVIAGDETEQRVEETNEGGSESAEINIPIPSDENNSSDPLLASEGASEDKRGKAHKSMGLSSSDISTQGQDSLPHDDGLGSEEAMKSKEQLEDLGKSNDEGGVGHHDSVKQSLLSIEEMAKDIEERILKAQKRVEWLKARKAMKQRNVTSARLGR